MAMAHLHPEPAPRLRPYHVAFTLLPFAALVAFAVFYALAQPNPNVFRTNAYAWGASVLAAPPLFLLVRRLGRQVLGQWWRLFWSFALILLLAHNIASLGWQHLWRPDLIAAEFGLFSAVMFWGLPAVWLVDVLMAWNRLDWARAEGGYAWWQGLVGTCVFFSFAPVLLAGGNIVSQALGGLLVLAVAGALLLRWYDGEEVP